MAFATFRLRTVEQLDTGFDSWSVDVVMPHGLLRMFAVHSRPPFDGADGWPADLATVAKAAEDDREIDLMVGDLNATPDHAAFHELIDHDFRSAAERTNAGWQPTWPDNGVKTFAGSRCRGWCRSTTSWWAVDDRDNTGDHVDQGTTTGQ